MAAVAELHCHGGSPLSCMQPHLPPPALARPPAYSPTPSPSPRSAPLSALPPHLLGTAGHLQNLDELADRYAGDAYAEGPTSPNSTLALNARADPRQLAAQTILRMYQGARGGDPLVLLSELQVGRERGCLGESEGQKEEGGREGGADHYWGLRWAVTLCLGELHSLPAARAWQLAGQARSHSPPKPPHPTQPNLMPHANPTYPQQGQYAFALLDGDKRQVFAARDSSGSEPLFFELGEDGAVSVSNATPPVPSGDEGVVQVGAGWGGQQGRRRCQRCCCMDLAGWLAGAPLVLHCPEIRRRTPTCLRLQCSGRSCHPGTSSQAARPACSSLR